jgi:pimeloyl-ACP methyl ester carboxylesterase
MQKDLSDIALVATIPGFTNRYVTVNGIQLHYVEGGKGQPLVLLPGWPETWWSYHKMMPVLAAKYHVIVVDIRGMGSSGKPAVGYDKRTMAEDVYQLIRYLGYDKVFVAGHDIGAMVAWSFAANHPEATAKLVMMEVPHPNEGFSTIPMLPTTSSFTPKIDETHIYDWWFAFNQVTGLPEQLLLGRVHYLHDWIFKYLLYDESAVDRLDRAVYVQAYDNMDGIRASNAWYQTFPQDIADEKTYPKLEMPVLGIGGALYNRLAHTLSGKTTNLKMVKAEGSGHFIPEETPKAAADAMIDFLN